MKKWSRKKKAFLFLLILFVGIQAIQPTKNNGDTAGTKDIAQVIQVPDTILTVLKISCYDCHSNWTTYPWYGSVSPVNLWLAFHVEEGKEELNFSAFGDYSINRQSESLEAIAETVKKRKMPLKSYLLMHRNAKLTVEQQRMIIDWAERARDQLPQP